MLKNGLMIVSIAALAWCGIGDAAAQPVLNDHRIMVSEHTGIRAIGSLVNRPLRPVQILKTDVPTTVVAGEEALFTAQVNVAHATLPIRPTWSFGDGNEAAGLSVRHTFTEPGRYVVRFTVSNRGSEATRSFAVKVLPDERAEST